MYTLKQQSKAQRRAYMDADIEKFRQDRHQIRKKMFTDGTLTLTKEGRSLHCLRMDGWCLAYSYNTDEMSKLIEAVCDAIVIARQQGASK